MVFMAEDPEGIPRAESEVITTSQMLAALPAPRSSSEIVDPSPVFVDLMMLSPIKPEKKQPVASPQVESTQKAPMAALDGRATGENQLGKSAPALGRISEAPRPLKQSVPDATTGCMPRDQQLCNNFLFDARQAASAAMAMAASGSMHQRPSPQPLLPRPSNQLPQQQPFQPLMQRPTAITGASTTAAGVLVPQMAPQPPPSPARIPQNCPARPTSLQCQPGFFLGGTQTSRGTQSSKVLGLHSINAAPATPSRPAGRGFLDAMAGARLSAPRPSIPGMVPMSCGSRAAGMSGLQQQSTTPPAALGLAQRPGASPLHSAPAQMPVPLRGTRLSSATQAPLHGDPLSTRAAASRGPQINLSHWQQQQPPNGNMMNSRQQQPWSGAPPLVGGGGGRLLSPVLQQQGTLGPPGIFLQPAPASRPHRTLMQSAVATSPLPPAMPFSGSGSHLKHGGQPCYMNLPGPRNQIRF